MDYMRTAKKLIRKLLPASMEVRALRARHTYQMNRIPRLEVNPIALPESAAYSLSELFGKDMANEWNAANQTIDEVFEYVDRTEAVCPGERRALWYLIRRFAPQRVLEVGTHIAGSTLYMAMALKANGIPSRFVTVDLLDVNDARIWAPNGLSESPRDMLARLDCAQTVEFAVRSSLDYLAGCQAEFDFIFLDGDHSASNLYREIPLALEALAPGGHLLMHDYYPSLRSPIEDGGVIPGPYLAVERFRREGSGLAALPLGSLPWPTKLGTNASSLALLVRE